MPCLAAALMLAHPLTAPAAAQPAPDPAPAQSAEPPVGRRTTQPVSPVNPGDLSKPAFDTTSPVYDRLPTPDIAATTVVAEVEGASITLGDVREAIAALPPAMAQFSFDEIYPGVLEKLIKEQALAIRARQRGLDQDPEYKRRVRHIQDKELANLFLERETEAAITETAILARYQRDIAGKPGPRELRLRVMMTVTQAQAEDLIARLRAGQDFATLARQNSKDPSAAAGGDLGFATLDRMVPELAGVVTAVPPGQIVPTPVRAGPGWFVIKVEERRDGPSPPFVAVRDRLRDALTREAVDPLAAKAEEGLTIRKYSFTGQAGGGGKPEDAAAAGTNRP